MAMLFSENSKLQLLLLTAFLFISLFLTQWWTNEYILARLVSENDSKQCDNLYRGYECRPEVSRFWGQYSPYFEVSSSISRDLPPQCTLTFVQILSRHGARDPTLKKTKGYQKTIKRLRKRVKRFHGKYKFLNDFEYDLGADQLNVFGAKQMESSGIKFYDLYKDLTSQHPIFVRSSGQQRVVDSATNFTQGYHLNKIKHGRSDKSYPYPIVVIPEGPESNNTLDHSLCTRFESGADSHVADAAKKKWASVFVPPIRDRFNKEMEGADLKTKDVLNMMQLCPFETVASPNGNISPFCDLLTEHEWHQYNYYESLEKFYRIGSGNPLGPTQGVGFANELLARMTRKPVEDHTSTNSTLDRNPLTFPIDQDHKIFADFSHDNDLTGIFFALGLYETPQLSNHTMMTIEETEGWSSAWTVPFAARAYFEKMICDGFDEELVRIMINDRVLPLKTCGGDHLGRCTLENFVKSMKFSRKGGHWDKCFADKP